MSKTFKIYNKDTSEWEIAASGNANGVGVTDPRLLPNGEIITSVNDVLVSHEEQLALHESYIAYLAEHGGGGGGGGGITTGDKITLTNSDITNNEGVNYLYTKDIENLRLGYLITSTTNNKRFFINVSLDGTEIISKQEGWANTPGNIIIPKLNQFSSNSSHSIVVTAIDNEGFSAESYLLTAVESSISLTSSTVGNTATVGLDYFFTYNITSKVVGQTATLVVKNITNGFTKTIDLGIITSTTPKQVNVNLWDLGSINAGSSYTIQGQAITTLGDNTIQSEITNNRVVVEDGVNLVVLIDGITTKGEVEGGAERTKFPQGGNISFSFTPYLAGVSLIYYAVRLEHNGEIRDIGYFDTGNYNDNQYVQKGKQQVFSWAIPTDGDILGNWNITLRTWSEKGDPVVDTILYGEIVSSTQSLMPDQNPNNSRYANWNIRLESFPITSTATSWVSKEPLYTPPGSLLPVGSETNINVFNSNGVLSGFITDKGQSKMRFAGESYGVIDIQPFNNAIESVDNWSKQGFSFSFTFKTDKHPFSDRTVLFIGDYDTDEDFSEGIKIGLDEIVWSYTDGNIKEKISCKIQQGVVNTVDFVVNKNANKKIVQIFKNGVSNAAKEIKNDFTWRSSSKMYLACDISNKGFIQNFCDVDFYDIKLFRAPLNDKEVVINRLNSKARANLLPDGSIDFTEYNSDKLRNFFSITDNSTYSSLWDDVNQTYADLNFNSLINDTTRTLPMDVMLINCANTGFTRSVYEEIGGMHLDWYSGCTMSYFSPTSGKSSAETTTDISIIKQGTSTLNNLSKNLDIRCDKVLKADDGGDLGYELFQPKETWFPERQYTLKADVVDSSHANNASIGKWINDNADSIFEKTPPMEYLESNRPKDTRDSSKIHDKVTIKHTLEGFPVILLIQFDGEEKQTMLGIYSFNLGRGSYYNMGFRFFKDFTTKIKNSSGQYVDNPLPAFVTSYHVYDQTEKFGDIDQRNVVSYEFTENANVIVEGNTTLPLGLFYQDDMSIIKHVGEFKYNGANWFDPTAPVTDNNIWLKLQQLFSIFAQMTGSTVQKYGWDDVSKGYRQIEGSYPAQSSWSTLAAELDEIFSIRNAYSYFLICVNFGLVDSLGKNLTIRNWNGKYYVSFYDMDTANGLDNVSLESVAKTAYIDTFSNNKNTAVNSLVITPNNADGGYDTYSSRMWDVLRDSRFINTGTSDLSYDKLWTLWRTNENLSLDSNKYVDEYFASQTSKCGELLFNYDYNIKYLTAYVGEQGGSPSYGNIEALHGTRIEYVRDWLKKRWCFFDGIFNYSVSSNLQPYNTRGTFACGGAESSTPYILVKSNTPAIFVVNVGNTSDTQYFLEENVLTEIRIAAISSFNTQITINNTTEINRLDGLREIRFQRFMNTMRLPSLAEIDLSYIDTLNDSPIDFDKIFINDEGYSDIRHINLSNCNFWAGNSGSGTFVVNIEKYIKLKDVNIANSVVNSMSLPNASLASVNITNSTIEIFSLVNQPFIDYVDYTGCRKLKTVSYDSCSKITDFTLSNLGDLSTIRLTNCARLKNVSVINNVNLRTIEVSNCNSVDSIDLSKCTSINLNFYFVGAPNIRSLNLSETNSSSIVELASSVPKLEIIDLHDSNIKAFKYGNKNVPIRDGYVLDVSKLNIKTLNVRNAGGLENIKFDNNSSKPFDVGASFFSGCTSLKRVYGHINLMGVSVFSGCNNFKIHEPRELVNGKTPMYNGEWFGVDTKINPELWDIDDNLETNVSIGTNSIYSCFYGTGCSLFDVYYILYKCTNVEWINSLFSSCKKIIFTVTDSPNRDMFKNCKKVKSIGSIFYSIGRSDGFILHTPTRNSNGVITNYNGVLSPLVSCTAMDSAFNTGSPIFTDDYVFCQQANGQDMLLTSMTYTVSSIKFISDASKDWDTLPTVDDYKPAKASRLLKHLPKLRTITGMFNYVNIEFDLVTHETGYNYCPIFYNNTELTTITSSFGSLIYSSGSLLNFLGGQIEGDTSHFPKYFAYIYNSFSLSSNSSVNFPIHNSMFRRIRGTLTNITTASAANNTSTGCFGGFTKYFQREDPSEVFPYEVFSRCTNLLEIPGFFYKMEGISGTEVNLPQNMFVDCRRLQNISYLFANMTKINYKLTRDGFKNCNLVNVANAFREEDSNFIKEGSVPYHLFYQEKVSNETIKGWNVLDAITDKINENFGIDEYGEWIPDDRLIYPLPKERSYSYVKISPKTTISKMDYVLCGFQSIKSESYTMNKGSLTFDDYGDLIIPNESYDIAKYIINPNYNPKEFIDEEETIPNPYRDIHRVIENPNYNPYQYAWNIWAYDGVFGLKEMIENSDLYQSVLSKKIDVSPIIPNEFNDINDNYFGKSSIPNKNIMNYIVPPDFFRYCDDKSGTSVNGAFFYCGRNTSGDGSYVYTDYGLRGRLCPYLFKPLTKITSLKEVFTLAVLLNPYRWNDTETNEDGLMFSPDQFKYNVLLQNISWLFSNILIPSKININGNQFMYNLNLQDISYCFFRAFFESTKNDSLQIPTELFKRNANLQNISYFLASDSSSSGWSGRSPKRIESGLFSSSKHKNIKTCSGLFYLATQTTGSVPELWTWLNNLTSSNKTNTFYGMKKSNITNSVNIPELWANGMTE